ncbi:hypothetical protein ACFQ3Z_00735 [Streptomyces nogalater]
MVGDDTYRSLARKVTVDRADQTVPWPCPWTPGPGTTRRTP